MRWVLQMIFKPIFHCNAKPFALGPCIGLDPQCHNLTLGIPTCWYLKTLIFALPPTPNLKFALPQTRTPMLGMYISCCLCQFHLHWVANANAVFSGIWALVYSTLRWVSHLHWVFVFFSEILQGPFILTNERLLPSKLVKIHITDQHDDLPTFLFYNKSQQKLHTRLRCLCFPAFYSNI